MNRFNRKRTKNTGIKTPVIYVDNKALLPDAAIDSMVEKVKHDMEIIYLKKAAVFGILGAFVRFVAYVLAFVACALYAENSPVVILGLMVLLLTSAFEMSKASNINAFKKFLHHLLKHEIYLSAPLCSSLLGVLGFIYFLISMPEVYVNYLDLSVFMNWIRALYPILLMIPVYISNKMVNTEWESITNAKLVKKLIADDFEITDDKEYVSKL
ncbi:hypothetical protein bpr_II011 (plasmid) [Butyrivibrio proteoclasticus B316]|uniref:Uncharacterized protein n=1 Tax=Butyrivibrio proteoclasticus (strain ATCC 51982 / DSM 14932 / B316) TaxID=515622 RepID=E0S3H0_BUTPB|nr:hypothetical protein [Butyrivibrio proteoclasticus]ADL35952.1 hypothetical protein bpr_II011 [Butyrivibrio proteoclasticus B316]